MIEIGFFGAVYLLVGAYWKVLCLLAGLVLTARALKARKKGSEKWSVLLAAGLCLSLFGGVAATLPALERAGINRGSILEIEGEGWDGFRFNGVDYEYLNLYNLIWPGPEKQTVYQSSKPYIVLDRAPNGPGLDILCRGVHLYCRADQVEEALDWYNDWNNYDVYLGSPYYKPAHDYAKARLLSPAPDGEALTAFRELSAAVAAEEAYRVGPIRGPREGSGLDIQIWPESDWTEQWLYCRSHDDLVVIEIPGLFNVEGRFCAYARNDIYNEEWVNIVVPLPEDLSDYFLAFWPEE